MTVRYQRVRQVRKGLAGVTATIGAVVLVIAAAPFAQAAPVAAPATPGIFAADPANAEDAKKAWLEAEQRASALNEEVLQAQETANQADIKVQRAALAVAKTEAASSVAKLTAAAATATATTATATAEQAAKEHATFQKQVDNFVNATVRGTSTSSLNSFLSAKTAEDYLVAAEQSRLVADDINVTLAKVAQAKTAANQARTAAQTASAEANSAARKAEELNSAAVAAKGAADQVKAEAQSAADAVKKRQDELQAESNRIKQLYNRLSNQERQSALAQQAAEREASAAADPSSRANRSQPRNDLGTPAVPPGVSGAAAVAVQAALSKNGSPYVWAATGPNAFDCSGLTVWAWAQAGVSLPRTSRAQATLPRVPLDQLQPGDLVTYGSPVHHVGMYIGNGQIIHASTPRTGVYITSVERGGKYPTGHRVTG